MDRCLESCRETISLRGLTGHALKGYYTCILAWTACRMSCAGFRRTPPARRRPPMEAER